MLFSKFAVAVTCNTSCLYLQDRVSKYLKIGHPKRKLVFEPSIFRCYVSFRDGKISWVSSKILSWVSSINVSLLKLQSCSVSAGKMFPNPLCNGFCQRIWLKYVKIGLPSSSTCNSALQAPFTKCRVHIITNHLWSSVIVSQLPLDSFHQTSRVLCCSKTKMPILPES